MITHNFWWPGMGCYVTEYMKGCALCNCTKTFLASLAGKLMPNCVPNCYWQVILVDIIIELPWSHGYDTIMVVVDHLSKCAHVIPMRLDVMASGVAQLFRDHIWKLHSLPEEVISEQGTVRVHSAVLCHHSPRRIFLTFRQDSLYSRC